MFNFKQQAEILGHYIGQFAELSKRLNAGMLDNAGSASHIDAIIGRSRFNRAAVERPDSGSVEGSTVLYGDALKRARSQKEGQHHGLFAALAAAHHPLLGFAQRLLIDLGKQGYTIHVQHEGQDAAIPLHVLKIAFDAEGRIFTPSATAYDDGGVKKHLPAGTVLLDNMYAEGYRKSETGALNCSITDNTGKPLSTDLVTTLLWTGIAGQGKNTLRGTGKDTVLTDLGIDDMDTANEFLVDAVMTLARQHGYNPKPLWDELMESARGQLAPHAEALAVTRGAIINSSTYGPAIIDRLVEFFDIKLPELDKRQQKIAAEIASGLATGMER